MNRLSNISQRGILFALIMVMIAALCACGKQSETAEEPAASEITEEAAESPAATGETVADDEWIMEFDGERVSVEELLYFTIDIVLNYSTSDNDYAAAGYDALTRYYVMESAAAYYGYTRSDEDMAAAKEYAAQYKEYLESIGAPLPKLSDEKWETLISAGAVSIPLYDKCTAAFSVDEDAFASSFEDYYNNQKAAWVDEDLKYIYGTDEESMGEALSYLNDGHDFDEAVAAFSVSYSEGDEIPTIKLETLTSFPAEALEAVLALEVGNRTGVLSIGEDDYPEYVIFEAQTKNVPTKDELRITFREDYETYGKLQMFNAAMDAFAQVSSIVRNDAVYDAFDLFNR